jgi:hypothetical protein
MNYFSLTKTVATIPLNAKKGSRKLEKMRRKRIDKKNKEINGKIYQGEG